MWKEDYIIKGRQMTIRKELEYLKSELRFIQSNVVEDRKEDALLLIRKMAIDINQLIKEAAADEQRN